PHGPSAYGSQSHQSYGARPMSVHRDMPVPTGYYMGQGRGLGGAGGYGPEVYTQQHGYHPSMYTHPGHHARGYSQYQAQQAQYHAQTHGPSDMGYNDGYSPMHGGYRGYPQQGHMPSHMQGGQGGYAPRNTHPYAPMHHESHGHGHGQHQMGMHYGQGYGGAEGEAGGYERGYERGYEQAMQLEERRYQMQREREREREMMEGRGHHSRGYKGYKHRERGNGHSHGHHKPHQLAVLQVSRIPDGLSLRRLLAEAGCQQ
ncbi:hypothetical protein KIPB_014233, partial [Kipferlia bialata]